MMSLTCLLGVLALLSSIGEAMGKVPSWVAPLLLSLALLLSCWPR